MIVLYMSDGGTKLKSFRNFVDVEAPPQIMNSGGKLTLIQLFLRYDYLV